MMSRVHPLFNTHKCLILPSTSHRDNDNMGGGGASEPVRVLAIFGSESGTAKAAIKGLATSLGKDGDVQIVDIKEGNSVGALETLKEKCAQHVAAVPRFTALICWGRLSCPAPGPPTELHSRWA